MTKRILPPPPRKRDVANRFWSKVEFTDECWNWTGAKTPLGYGRFGFNGTTVYPHRAAYEELVAPIPAGLTIDHLCKNSSCLNPAHLEAVTQRVNNLRSSNSAALNAAKTECPKCLGPFTENSDGRRQCTPCLRVLQAASLRRRRAAQRAGGVS